MKKSTLIATLFLLVLVIVFGCEEKKQTGGELSDDELEGIDEQLGEDRIDESANREVDSDLGELSGDGEEFEEIEGDNFEDGFSSDEELGAEESLNEEIEQGLEF